MTEKTRKKITQTEFLSQLYKRDKYVSNTTAFQMLKQKFPETKTTQRILTTSWKYIIRKRGIEIPLQK